MDTKDETPRPKTMRQYNESLTKKRRTGLKLTRN